MNEGPDPLLGLDSDPALGRLEDQIRWYSGRSKRNQRFYKWLRSLTIVSAAAIPVVTVLNAPRWLAATLGAAIVAMEGILQLNQYQSLWINYRATGEALKHEKYLYLARAGDYANATDPHQLLAERIEGLISQEDAKWVSVQQRVPAASTMASRATATRTDQPRN